MTHQKIIYILHPLINQQKLKSELLPNLEFATLCKCQHEKAYLELEKAVEPNTVINKGYINNLKLCLPANQPHCFNHFIPFAFIKSIQCKLLTRIKLTTSLFSSTLTPIKSCISILFITTNVSLKKL